MEVKKTDLTFCGQPRDPDKLMFGMAMRCEPDASADNPAIKNLLEFNFASSRHNTDWLDLRCAREAEYVTGPVQEDEQGPFRLIGWCVRTDHPWREESGEKFLHTTETSITLSHLWDAVGNGECSEDVYQAVLMSFWLLPDASTAPKLDAEGNFAHPFEDWNSPEDSVYDA